MMLVVAVSFGGYQASETTGNEPMSLTTKHQHCFHVIFQPQNSFAQAGTSAESLTSLFLGHVDYVSELETEKKKGKREKKCDVSDTDLRLLGFGLTGRRSYQ